MTFITLFLLNALAVHRLTKLVIDDKITEPARERLFARWSPEDTWTYLFTCPWCVSIWMSILAVAGTYLFFTVWLYVALVLALSSFVGLISTVEDRI